MKLILPRDKDETDTVRDKLESLRASLKICSRAVRIVVVRCSFSKLEKLNDSSLYVVCVSKVLTCQQLCYTSKFHCEIYYIQGVS